MLAVTIAMGLVPACRTADVLPRPAPEEPAPSTAVAEEEPAGEPVPVPA